MEVAKAGRWLSFFVIALIVITLIVGGCDKASPPAEEEEEEEEEEVAPPVTIAIKSFAFNPRSITVKKGTTIRWSQQDSVTHTVTSTSSPPGVEFDSGNLRQGETFDYTFTVAGTYEYRCQIHTPPVTGKIIVSE